MTRRIVIAAVILHALGCAHPGAPAAGAASPASAAGGAGAAGGSAAKPVADPHAGKPMVNPHATASAKAACDRCHEPGASTVKTDPIALCAECHDPARMRHPFRVEAPAHAEGLPLMPGRVIACHTCHDPHDPKARRGGLRMAYGELCLKCHERHAPKPAAPAAVPDGGAKR